jgi:hypothetical protein
METLPPFCGTPWWPKEFTCTPVPVWSNVFPPAKNLLEHFDFEEEYCFPLMPQEAQDLLERQHELVKFYDFNRPLLLRHFSDEMKLVNRYCPNEIAKKIAYDHELYRRGLLPLTS